MATTTQGRQTSQEHARRPGVLETIHQKLRSNCMSSAQPHKERYTLRLDTGMHGSTRPTNQGYNVRTNTLSTGFWETIWVGGGHLTICSRRGALPKRWRRTTTPHLLFSISPQSCGKKLQHLGSQIPGNDQGVETQLTSPCRLAA